MHKMYKSALIVHKRVALTVDVLQGGCVSSGSGSRLMSFKGAVPCVILDPINREHHRKEARPLWYLD